jgi:hypothetical protein
MCGRLRTRPQMTFPAAIGAHGWPPDFVAYSADALSPCFTVFACSDIAADLISEPSMGTNLDITATDQIKPIATTMAIPIDVRICIPLSSSLTNGSHIFRRPDELARLTHHAVAKALHIELAHVAFSVCGFGLLPASQLAAYLF